MAADPITFGESPVSESGVGSPTFPELNVAVWYSGDALIDAASETDVAESATVRTVPEEGGTATVGGTGSGQTQARIVYRGAWDVVLIDSFDRPSVVLPDCSLVLEVYNAEGTAVAWEVGTSPTHPNSYLVEPENYAAQEIDVVAGAATIGQVEVLIVDRRQTPGDQDSGWVTGRLAEGGVPAIRGRRCRLIRYISDEIGFVVIADGPAGTPRLDGSYAAYQFVIKDVRESEREIRAFTRNSSWIYPLGVEDGFGQYEDAGDGSTQWLVDPADPLVGVYREVDSGGQDQPGGGDYRGLLVLSDYFPDGLDSSFFFRPDDGDALSSRDAEFPRDFQELTLSEFEVLDEGTESNLGKRSWHEFATTEILWRPEGSEAEWTVIKPAWMEFLTGAGFPASIFPMIGPSSNPNVYVLPDTTEVTAPGGAIRIRGPDMDSTWDGAGYVGQLTEGNFPEIGDRVEFAVRYRGEPEDRVPLYVEFDDDGSRMTAGRLLQKLYDGEYSSVDEETGDVIPTGIRYDEDALLGMTDLVRLRITEPVDDLRDWTEKHLYAPTGWVPSLNNELEIAPSSQVPPADFSGAPTFTDENVEPVPVWNAGELILNFLEYVYPRYYDPGLAAGDQAESIDNLESRDVVFQYRSETSLSNKEKKVEFDGAAFAAVGDPAGERIVENEVGEALALDRRLYVFDRYNTGAQTIEVPVRRTVSTTLKPGVFVVVALSWLPDYLTRRRGTVYGGQIVAIHDIDCEWRVLLLEEVVPLALS